VKSAELKAVKTLGSPEIPLFPQKGLESNDFARGGEGSAAGGKKKEGIDDQASGFLAASRERKGKELPGRME
jgi:hypothetical protein